MKKKKIRLPLSYEVANFDSERFLKVRIKVMHSGLNLNNSYFGSEVVEKARPTLANVPILAFVRKEDGNSNEDFAGHEFEIKITEDNMKYVYLGRPIGIIPETNNYSLEVDEDGKVFVVVDGYVWKQYANSALDIINRDQVKKVSMEVLVNDYDWEETHVNILDYSYTGVAMLGEDVREAMIGAKAEIINYSKNTISDMMFELKQALEGGREEMEENQNTNTNTEEETFDANTENNTDAEETNTDVEKTQHMEENNTEEDGAEEQEENAEENFQAKIEALEAQISTLQSENARLSAFVDATVEKAKQDAVAELFEKFSDLSENEEVKSLLAKAEKLKLSDLETQLYALRGRLGTFSVKEDVETPKPKISDYQKLMFKYNGGAPSELPEWAVLVEKHKGEE